MKNKRYYLIVLIFILFYTYLNCDHAFGKYTFYGDKTSKILLATAAIPKENDSEIVNDTIPTTMEAGHSYSVSVTLKNTGTKTWTLNDKFSLGGVGDSDPFWISTTSPRVNLDSSESISTGQSKTFYFTLVAATTLGNYTTDWQMIKEGVEWFGKTDTKQVTVIVASALKENDSEIINDTIPTTMEVGHFYRVSVTLKNTGTSTWSMNSNFKLGSTNIVEPFWNKELGNIPIVSLDNNDSTPTGKSKNFYFTLLAPMSQGSYTTNWTMIKNGIGAFGAIDTKQIVVTAASPLKENDSEIISDTIPTIMEVGHSYQVSVTLKNTGTKAWTLNDKFRLGGVGNSDPFWNSTINPNPRVDLDSSDSILLGQSKTFYYTMVAPTTLGNYTTDWQMIKEGVAWFGKSDIKQVTVLAAAPIKQYNAEIINDTIPTTMEVGHSYRVSATIKNTGTTTWTSISMIKLGGVGNSDPLWDKALGTTPRLTLDSNESVITGQSRTFYFTVVAPITLGSYTTDWQMIKEGVVWFGDIDTKQVSVVAASPLKENDAAVISDTIPTTMEIGRLYQVSITLKNTGTSTWVQSNSIRLGGVGNTDPLWNNTSSTTPRINLDSIDNIAPNQTKTFKFNLVAPTITGKYITDWGMIKEGLAWFGEVDSKQVDVIVPSTLKTNDSEIVSDTIPTTMEAGHLYHASVTFKNTGSSTWTVSNMIKLGAIGNSDPFWDKELGIIPRIVLDNDDNIATGQTKTIYFSLTAPITLGNCTTNWKMLKEGIEWFGHTLSKDISITSYKSSIEMPIEPGIYYDLINHNSGKCIGIKDISTADGSGAVQNTRNYQDKSQHWLLEYTSEGYYKFTTKNSNLCLDVDGSAGLSESKLIQKKESNLQSQKWKIEPTDDGYYKITSVNNNLSVGVKNQSLNDGEDIVQTTSNSSNNQEWEIVMSDSTTKDGSTSADFTNKVGTTYPEIFGGNNNYSFSDTKNYATLKETGFTMVRTEAPIFEILPKDITISDYKNNVNDVQNSQNWNWSDADLKMNMLKKNGYKVLFTVDYCPKWLTYNGDIRGVPKDWEVYEDIVKKIYQRYQNIINYIEVWNEPDGMFLLTDNSEYSDKLSAYKDIYKHTVKAIKSINKDVMIGGFASSNSYNFSWLDSLLKDSEISENLDFLSYHSYSTNSDNENVMEWKKNLEINGKKDLPIFITEWNYDAVSNAGSMNSSNTKAISFVGNRLTNQINTGIRASMMYSLKEQQNESGFYCIDNKGGVVPKTSVFWLLSNQLGLGKGNSTVYQTVTNNLINSFAVVNSNGQDVVCLVNDSGREYSINVKLNNLQCSSNNMEFNVYEASSKNDGVTVRETKMINISNGNGNIQVEIPPYSVVGIIQKSGLEIPKGLTAKVIDSNSISLSWDTLNGATGYNIYKSTQKYGKYTKVNEEPIVANLYNNLDLDEVTTYYYKISGFFTDGESEISGDSVEATTLKAPPKENDSEIICDTIPTIMEAGHSYRVSVTLKNTGTKIWTLNDMFRLGGVGNSDPLWSSTTNTNPRVDLDSSDSISMGQSKIFYYTMVAPITLGNYTTDWQMIKEGAAWFGKPDIKQVTVITASSIKQYNAEIINDTIPTNMEAGHLYRASVTLKNTGTATWNKAGMIKLGGVGNSDPLWDKTLGTSPRLELDNNDNVTTGQSKIFYFTVLAPTILGNYTTDWQMIKEGVVWFGDIDTKQVSVVPALPLKENDSEIISDTIPTIMEAGHSYQVSVTLKNTGTKTWTLKDNFRLGGVGNSDPLWSSTTNPRVDLDSYDSILIGQSKIFYYTMVAPTTLGNYTTDWQMIKEGVAWFGKDDTKQVTVIAATSIKRYNAEIINDTIPTTMEAGHSYRVSVTLKNTGSETWTKDGMIKLGGVGNSDPLWDKTLGASPRLILDSNDSVAKGQNRTFYFTVVAPTILGNYATDWQMIKEGVVWFGDIDTKQVSVVAASQLKVNDAAVISDTIPTTMETGRSYQVSITLKNTGTSTWEASDMIRLGGIGNTDPFWNNTSSTTPRINLDLSDNIAPGQTKTFKFNLVAPTITGKYITDWGMIKEGLAWFGEIDSKQISVN